MVFGLFESKNPRAILEKIYNDILALRKSFDDVAESISLADAVFKALLHHMEIFMHDPKPKNSESVLSALKRIIKFVKVSEAYDEKEERIVLDIEKKLVKFSRLPEVSAEANKVNSLIDRYHKILDDLVALTKLLSKAKNALFIIERHFQEYKVDESYDAINQGLKPLFAEMMQLTETLNAEIKGVNVDARNKLLGLPELTGDLIAA